MRYEMFRERVQEVAEGYQKQLEAIQAVDSLDEELVRTLVSVEHKEGRLEPGLAFITQMPSDFEYLTGPKTPARKLHGMYIERCLDAAKNMDAGTYYGCGSREDFLPYLEVAKEVENLVDAYKTLYRATMGEDIEKCFRERHEGETREERAVSRQRYEDAEEVVKERIFEHLKSEYRPLVEDLTQKVVALAEKAKK
jgi:hypothetical protein